MITFAIYNNIIVYPPMCRDRNDNIRHLQQHYSLPSHVRGIEMITFVIYNNIIVILFKKKLFCLLHVLVQSGPENDLETYFQVSLGNLFHKIVCLVLDNYMYIHYIQDVYM